MGKKRDNLKKIIAYFVLALILIGFLLILVLKGEDVKNYVSEGVEYFGGGEDVVSEGDSEVVLNEDDLIDEEIVSSDSGGGGSGSSSSEVIEEETVCVNRQIQYSLKNFEEEVKCLEYGISCVEIVANCSVEIYSFEEGLDNFFEVEYSLINSSGSVLDSQVIREDVVTGGFEIVLANFNLVDENGIDEDLECVFSMRSVPIKRVC